MIAAAQLAVAVLGGEADVEVAGAVVDDEILDVEAAAGEALLDLGEVGAMALVAGAQHHHVHLLGNRLVLGVVEVLQHQPQVVAAAVLAVLLGVEGR